MSVELLRAPLREERDVFVVRQWARQVAGAVGIDGPDQVRVATALSEIGRDLLSNASGGSVTFELDALRGELSIQAVTDEPVVALAGAGDPAAGVDGARRLVGTVTVAHDPSGRVVVTMKKSCPAAAGLAPAELAELQGRLSSLVSPSPLEELRSQNRELLTTLEALQQKRDELLRLNAELQETNTGVLALYGQLSQEMEATNKGVLALYAEIDERSVQLREANEAKSRFLASASHELRTPANSIIALGSLLLESDDPPLGAEQRRAVELVRSSATDMLRLVNGLLDLAKAESGRLQPQPEPVALGPLFAKLRGTLLPLSTSPDVRLVIAEPGEPVALESDPTLLMRVLRNLVANALKFTERGEVRLEVMAAPEGWVRFIVSDTGIGIPAEHVPRLFEDFYQVPGPAQARFRGTGLGLPYAKRLAELLGGTISVESTLGRGSVFTVELPGVLPRGLLQRAVVADDDPAFRHALRAMLQGAVGEVSESGTGAGALELMAAETPDVLFLDLTMPDLDARAVLERMAGDPALARVPVVLVTSGNGDQSLHAPCLVTTLSKSGLDRDRLRAVLVDVAGAADAAGRGAGPAGVAGATG